ncbi:MAG TPA: glycosyltransferase family 4 protein, partial [Flavobacterium sp.]|nr:glycosyltransferase family 4 protein [Flavobacterium sp.]
TFPKVDGFHAVSHAIAIETQKYKAQPDKIKVVYSGLSKINRAFSEKTSNKTFRILSVGRSHWIKGYHYALDAMKIISDKGIDSHYTIIGAKDSEELEFQKSDLGLDKLVEFKGNVPFQEVQKIIFESDLVLLPSVEEGIANVVLEAMQIGTLVLSTDCGGMNEVIENGKNGFIVPGRNPEKMAEAIQKIILLSENERQKITLEAQKTINQNHTDTKMVSDMISLYKTVLNQ